jgi:hypothetical protein
VFKVGPLGSYFAGIATVVIALSGGFAVGARVGSSWGNIERLPAVATKKNRPMLAAIREIPLVQTVEAESVGEETRVPKAKADKAAARRKDAPERRKIARAERRKNAERSRQIAFAAAKMRAAAMPEELKAVQSVGSNLGLATQASSQPSLGNDHASGGQVP